MIVLPSEVSCECQRRKVELLLRRRLALLGGCTNKRQLSLGAAVIALSSETEQLQVERPICSVCHTWRTMPRQSTGMPCQEGLRNFVWPVNVLQEAQ
jgi:hypothetical protein